jgi:hypothetical protein
MAKLPVVVDSFVKVMGQTLLTDLDAYGALTEVDEAARERFGEDKVRISREVDQFIQSSALGLAGGKRRGGLYGRGSREAGEGLGELPEDGEGSYSGAEGVVPPDSGGAAAVF